MGGSRKRWQRTILLSCILSSLFSLSPGPGYPEPISETQSASVRPTVQVLGADDQTERTDGYYVLMTEGGKRLTATALPVSIGDEFIAADNKHYRVFRVQRDSASVQYLGVDQLAYDPAWDEEPTARAAAPASTASGSKPIPGKEIAVYHTHTDESYIPTDGAASIYGNGGILKVGYIYSRAMRQKGIAVDHSLTRHDPHDANAYQRSRRTAVKLMQKNPVALVDVHRDAVPPDVYLKRVDGQEVTQVKLVVGRSNVKQAQNLQFAKNIKSYVDKHEPGLIEGIFIGKGNYNQDLSPRAILIEVGAHTNSRYLAQGGATLFSDAIPRVAGVYTTAQGPLTPPRAPGRNPAQTAESRSAWSIAAWIILAIILGTAAFLLVSAGGVKEAWNRIKTFRSEEFANAFLRKKLKKRK